jgi:hypothetical protein
MYSGYPGRRLARGIGSHLEGSADQSQRRWYMAARSAGDLDIGHNPPRRCRWVGHVFHGRFTRFERRRTSDPLCNSRHRGDAEFRELIAAQGLAGVDGNPVFTGSHGTRHPEPDRGTPPIEDVISGDLPC